MARHPFIPKLLIVSVVLASLGVARAGATTQSGDSSLPEGFPRTPRVERCINPGWRFHLGDPDASYHGYGVDDSTWEEVSLPHTLKLTSLNLDGCRDDKFQLSFHRTVGWYRREIQVTADTRKKVFLEFEGAHQVTDLWVNGRHVGQHSVSGYTPFHFDIEAFTPGTLEARGFTAGEVVVSSTIHTPGTPTRLELVMDSAGRTLVADGADILVGHAHVVDENGTTLRKVECEVHFSVTGPASVVGDGAEIGANPLSTRRGVAPVLLRAGREPGTVTLTARAEGLEPAVFTVETIANRTDRLAAVAGPIHDFESVRVDLGAEGQLIQFGWIPWSGVDNEPSEKHFDALGGFTASLKPASDDGILRWLGELNVIGKYAFAYGEGVLAIDAGGLVLELTGLPPGTYRLRTWHHAPRSNTDSMDPNRERLRKLNVHKLPYAEELSLEVTDAGGYASTTIAVTSGKEMQFQPVAIAGCTLVSDGTQPVRVVFRDPRGGKGIWLNAFELGEWFGE